MKNLTKYLLIIIILIYNLTVKGNEIEKVLFSIDSLSFTSIDLDNRKKYIDLIRDKEFDKKDQNFYLEDLISVNLFNIEYNKNNFQNKRLNDLINEYYEKVKFENINQILKEDKIKENIKYDFQRKFLLENLLDTQKDIIFQKNKEELTEIYKINLEYFSFNFKNHELLTKILKKRDYLNIINKKADLKKENIKYIYSNKEIKFNNVINDKIKEAIKNDKKYFNFRINESTNIYGKITKKIKIDKELKFTLVQINRKNDNKIFKTSCNEIDNLKEDKNLKIKIIENIDYYKLNQTIKDNLFSLNDRIIIRNDNEESHIILCDIKYNKEDIKKMNIDNRVNYLVSKIEQNFILQKKEEFKFILYD